MTAAGGVRRLLAVLAPVLLVLVTLAPVASAQVDPGQIDPGQVDPRVAATDRLVVAPIDVFVAARTAQDGPLGLDWSSDGCSVPVVREPERSIPQGFDFRAACERHDFGYRNQRAQGRFTEESRRALDDGFRADMGAVCGQQSGWFGFRERLCDHIADDYYFWVRSCSANPAPYCPLVARDWVDDHVETWEPPRL